MVSSWFCRSSIRSSIGSQVGRRGGFVAPHELGLADDVVQLLLILGNEPVEVALGLLETTRLARARDDEQQDDGAEAAANRVEKRHAEHFELAASSHGQSSDGASSEPPVRSDSSQ